MASILVIEDDQSIQKLINITLKTHGYESIFVASGEEGLDLLQSGCSVDLIILDLFMPGMSGMDVLKILQNDKKSVNTPVLMLSALVRTDVVAQGLELGARDFITKPFHPKDLVNRVAKLLNTPESA
jgi:DNA-binding response OmpR family regulator